MVKRMDCGKEVPEEKAVYCYDCRAPICEKCGALGLCSNCVEAWHVEEDLEAMEEEWLWCGVQ